MPKYPQFLEKQITNTQVFVTPLERNATAIQFSFEVGSFLENETQAGISHLIEHLLFNGSKKYPSQKIIAESIKKYGGRTNAFTGVDETGFWIYMPASAIEKTLDILFDITFNPLAISKEKEINNEKKIILEEIKLHRDNPEWHIFELANQTLNPDHKIAVPIIGYEKTVARITKEEVKEWWKKYYLPANLKIAIAGYIPKNIEEEIKKFLPAEDKKIKNNFPKYHSKQKLRLKVHPKDTDQVKLIIIFENATKIKPKEMITFELMTYILGDRMGSILSEELRVKEGLCYDVWGDIDNYNDFSLFSIGGGFNEKKIERASQKIVEILNQLKTQGFGEEKVREAKTNYLGNLEIKCDDTAGLTYWPIFDTRYFGKILSFEKTIEILNSIGKNDLDNLAKKLFQKSNMAITTLGSFKNEKSLKLIFDQLKDSPG